VRRGGPVVIDSGSTPGYLHGVSVNYGSTKGTLQNSSTNKAVIVTVTQTRSLSSLAFGYISSSSYNQRIGWNEVFWAYNLDLLSST